MNKTILIIGFLLINVCAAYSQTAIGKVVDEKQVSVPYANVVLLSLPDSTFVQGTVTDEQGNFALGGIEQGSILISAIRLYCIELRMQMSEHLFCRQMPSCWVKL